jgi:two-component system sensor histidine kinase KdpD
VVSADRSAVAQILQNLLLNGQLYAPGRPVRISARAVGSRVVVRVADGGAGIPASEREAIFRRGWRGRSSLGQSGSGLGLYVAHRLATAMQGSLYLDGEEPGGGATFVLELPAATSRSRPNPRRKPHPSEAAAGAACALVQSN